MSRHYTKETTEAVSAIVANLPFFAVILFDLLKIKENPSCPTAATDGRNIIVGDWFRKLPIKQRVFVLAHEIMHVIFEHLPRARLYRERGFGPDLSPWNDQKFNRAADYYINYLLDRDKVGEMPPIGLLDHRICGTDATTVDDIYMALPDSDEENFDQHLEPAESGDNAPPTQQQVQGAVIAARNTAKAMGKMPGGLERLIGEILEPTQPWKELLRDFITSSVGHDDTSWARPNRRRLALPPHVPFPGTEGHSMGTMVIAVDTSGSISEKELSAFMGEMKGIIEQVRPRELWVCWWDTKAKLVRIDEMDDLDDPDKRAVGGGGTDYHCVEPALLDEWLEPEIVVCLTDGMVSWPQDFPFEHLTVTTSEAHTAPFGRNIYMDVNTDRV